MNRLLEWLSQTSPDETMIAGTSLAAARVRRVLRQLRERAQNEDKAGDRARRMLEYLESGNTDDVRFEGVSLFKLQSAVERARSRTRASAGSAPAEDRSATGKTLQTMITEVTQGNPGDTWVDGVNVTRLEQWLARLRQRGASDASALSESPTGKTISVNARSGTLAPVDTATGEAPRPGRTRGGTDRKPEWIEDFLD